MKNLSNWLKEYKVVYQALIENLQIIVGIVLIFIIIPGLAGLTIGLFFNVSWKAFASGVAVLFVTSANITIICYYIEKFDTLNPIKIWQQLFWTELKFPKNGPLKEALEDWFDCNCVGKWTNTDKWHTYKFAKKEDAIHAKLVWNAN